METEALVFKSKSRARTKMRVEQVGWVETGCARILDMMIHDLPEYGRSRDPQGVAIDEYRVTQAMDPAWRYTEPEGVRHEYMIAALQTSAWFSLDREALDGATAGANPEIDDLPPLPYRRIALDGGKPPNNLFEVTIVSVESGELLGEVKVPCAVIFEIEQGRLWDVLITVIVKDSSGGPTHWREGPLMGYHMTPGGHKADYDALRALQGWREEAIEVDKRLGEVLWKNLVTAVHMIEATNVVYTRQVPGRKQRRAWEKQRYRYREPQIYRVDLVSYEGEPREGRSDREYHVRWMVRGHYRHTPHGEHLHPRTGLPATWIKAHVKGPADAPWKGRPTYRQPEGAK